MRTVPGVVAVAGGIENRQFFDKSLVSAGKIMFLCPNLGLFTH